MPEHMETDIEKETEAIRIVVQALEPLSPEARMHVVNYVLMRLGIALSPSPQVIEQPKLGISEAPQSAKAPHISELKEQKKPHSASEMAALVAYYLANVAPAKERKDRVKTKDIETYFKIAQYPLPEKIEFTLPNAKAAGYLDAVGNGEYRLNAVGHNLVVHSMPRTDSGKTSTRRTVNRGRRSAKKR